MCPKVPTGLIVMGVLFLLAIVAFVRADLAHWEQLAALQLLANYLQNLPVEILQNTFLD